MLIMLAGGFEAGGDDEAGDGLVAVGEDVF